jgi:hypothetical protein
VRLDQAGLAGLGATSPDWLPELSVKKTDKLRPFLNFQLQVTSSYFKFFVIARRHPIGTIRNYHGNQRLATRDLRSRFDRNRNADGFGTAPFAADCKPKMSKTKEPSALSMAQISFW